MKKKFFHPKHTRLFNKYNPFWNDRDRIKNAMYVHSVQVRLNNQLRGRGYVSLNDALYLLGFGRTVGGGMAGWIRDVDPAEGDGYIDFGIWDQGYTLGRDWLRGEVNEMSLYFNVDRAIETLPRRIQKLKAEGKL